MPKYPVTAFLLFLAFLSNQSTKAQTPVIQSKTYPQNIFRYPLDIPPSTAGGFGELRGNHFHSGLDFRTNQREGYPVHAAYDGYISRLRVQFGGFGNAVYITHPNGYTSVYGHLQRFSPELLQAIRDEQRKQQKDIVDFSLTPMQFPVYKGQIVAWSGNTGGSAGPHLHFELRDSETEQTINAQLFGLTIPDQVPPSISAIAVYRLNGNPFSEKTAHNFYAVTGAAGHYRMLQPQVLEIGREAGLGIACIDQNSASANRNGAYSIEVKLDGTTIYTMAMERFAFDQTHAINAYIDYPTAQTTGRMIQKCFVLPGSKISIYPQAINRGIIKLTDDEVHDVEYVVKDVAGNTSTIAIKVKAGSDEKSTIVPTTPGSTRFHYDQTNTFTNDGLKVIIPPGNLYDDLDFTFSKLPKHVGAYSATYHLHNRLTPIHDEFDVWIKPDSTIGQLANKAVIIGAGDAIYEDGYVKAKAKGFGDFYVKVDNEPPFIRPINIVKGGSMAHKPKISFKIGDSLSGIKSYIGKIDGEWVLMEWDFKTKVLNYTFDTSITPGKHTLELTVTDNKDNAATYTADFYR
ncbi:M23 family metallopeptidase [Mucilaginibacter agri]|uniref:Peptidoglycan DD-metalloendopeptidase family protein n=1 Tax=Mucilaginibacter agri TaxID=2695265 RepID=A0A965ZEE5_9SPHI|nr:M23 family metallopeptidase [Mucilaginibacter agri]NCD68474.1 peptidoglycan DD-metalloendopeptidase family protein [Mucilaginibacter agri]